MSQTTQPQGILGSGLRDGLQLKPVRYQWAMEWLILGSRMRCNESRI